jgi:hypothetical protein
MNSCHIGARVTPEMHATFLALGGNLWLRKQLEAAAKSPAVKTQARYEEIGKRYAAGEKVAYICAEMQIDQATVMRAVRALGLPRRLRKVGA